MTKLMACLLSGWFIFILHSEGTKAVTTGPDNTVVTLGDTLVLNCSSDTVSGNNFTWSKVDEVTGGDGDALGGCLSEVPPAAPYRFIAGEKSCDLIVDSVTRAEALLYRCEPLGQQSASASASVSVIDYLSIKMLSGVQSFNTSWYVEFYENFTVKGDLGYSGSMTPILEWSTDGLTVVNKSRSEQNRELTETVTLFASLSGAHTIFFDVSLMPSNQSVVKDVSQNIASLSASEKLLIDVTFPTTVLVSPDAWIPAPMEENLKGLNTGLTLSTAYKQDAICDSSQLLDKTGQIEIKNCDCYVCSYNRVNACQDWEIVVFVFSALIGLSTVTLLSLFVNKSAKKMKMVQYVVTGLCGAFLIVIIAVGCSFYKCIEQLIVMIVFSVLGGLTVITSIGYFIRRWCMAETRKNNKRTSRF